jgi:4-amino-4-deoxy-L-arabinose transferase-like glycosyltransferase
MKWFVQRVGSNISGLSSSPYPVGLALACVLLLATWLRLWGLWFGLPYVYHPDEPVAINMAVKMLQNGELNPHFFHWGTAYFYLVAVAYVPYYLGGMVLGRFHSRLDLSPVQQYGLGVGYIPLPAEVWIARLVSVLLGVGTVWLVYLIGRALYNRQAGLLAAALLAVSSVHATQSHFAVPDVAMIFFVCLSVLSAIRWVEQGRRSDNVWVGFWGGLAAATKYNAAGLLLLIVGAAQLLRYGRRAWRKPDILCAGGGAVLGFVLGVPSAVIATSEFWDGVTFTLRHYGGGHAGMEGESLLWYLRFLSRQGLLPLLAIGGMIWGLARRVRVTILVSVVTLAYLGLISTYTVRNERTILPLFPLMAALGGVALVWIGERTSQVRHLTRPLWRTLILVVLFGTFVPPLTRVIAADRNLTRQATQTLAREWIIANIPAGTRVASEAYTAVLHPTEYETIYLNSAIDHERAWYCEQGVEYVVMSEMAHGRFFADPDRYLAQVRDFERLMAELELVHETCGTFLSYADRCVNIFRVPCDAYSE